MLKRVNTILGVGGRSWPALRAAIVAACLIVPLSPASAGDASVTSLTGDGFLLYRTTGSVPVPLIVGTTLGAGDRILAGPVGIARLRYSDGCEQTVASAAGEVTIGASPCSPGQSAVTTGPTPIIPQDAATASPEFLDKRRRP